MAGVSVNKVFCVIKQDWLGVEKAIPIGSKWAHSFTGRCLLCNPMGCHGDHMLRRVDVAPCQKTRALPGKVKHACVPAESKTNNSPVH